MAKLQAYILINDGSPKKQWYMLKDMNNHHYVVSFVDSTLEYYPTLQESRDLAMHKLRMNTSHMLGRIRCTNNMGVSCIFSLVPTHQSVRLNIIMMSKIPWIGPTLC